jgi:hypothetical protein
MDERMQAMTADAFAQLVQAQRTGTGHWRARCPAHGGRSRSLSITEGRGGCIVLHCFAGCPPDAILAVLKLSWRDLFQGPPPSPERLGAMEAGRIAAERQRLAARATEREAWDKVRRWSAVVDALGVKLVRTPENMPAQDTLTTTFHDAFKWLHDAEVAAPSGGLSFIISVIYRNCQRS